MLFIVKENSLETIYIWLLAYLLELFWERWWHRFGVNDSTEYLLFQDNFCVFSEFYEPKKTSWRPLHFPVGKAGNTSSVEHRGKESKNNLQHWLQRDSSKICSFYLQDSIKKKKSYKKIPKVLSFWLRKKK